jgi:hypothetical protein
MYIAVDVLSGQNFCHSCMTCNLQIVSDMYLGGVVRAFINGVPALVNGAASPKPIGINRPIPDGGQLVLGQLLKPGRRSDGILQHHTSDDVSMFDDGRGFFGELGFVNIWGYVLTSSDIRLLHADCNLIYCGDVVEWADFRNGRTRGWLRVLWPSKIFSSHLDATFSKL